MAFRNFLIRKLLFTSMEENNEEKTNFKTLKKAMGVLKSSLDHVNYLFKKKNELLCSGAKT